MKISLITACRNAAKTISTTMESVRRQRLDGFELEYLVIDGASSDGTVEIVREFAETVEGMQPNFSFRWLSEKDRSLYDGINKGIGMSTGDVVGICNADDILSSDDTLSSVNAAFSCSSALPLEATYADVRFVRAGAESVDELRSAKTARYCTGRFFRNWHFRFATFPAHPSTFIRRECFERLGVYSLDYPICADFELMLRFLYLNKIRARYLPICTHVMRTGGLSTKGLAANLEINREDLRALRSHGVFSCLPLIYLKYFAKIWGCILTKA